MEALKRAVQAYSRRHVERDGLAITPVRGLRMMCIEKPSGALHSVYRPIVCFVLQGAKRVVVGSDEQILREGQSAVFAAGMLVVGEILEASQEEPFLSIAVELEIALLRDLAVQIGEKPASRPTALQAPFAEDDADGQTLDCASRLLQLLHRPDAAAILRPGIMCELHYWLLSGRHGETLRTLGDPASYASRLAPAIAMLREQYRSRIRIEQLARAASMSLTAFHKHFKMMTSLTPGQYRKRLRLIEARRLMLDEGCSVSRAAFKVGYESASQFTREYRRLFLTPPKQDVLALSNANTACLRAA